MVAFDRGTLSTIVLVLFVVLGLSMTAATIQAVSGSDGQLGINFDPAHGSNGDSELNGPDEPGENGLVTGEGSIDMTICIELLRSTEAILGIFGAVALFSFGVYRYSNLATTLLVGSGVIPLIIGVYFFLTNCTTGFGGGVGGGDGLNPGSGQTFVQAPGMSSWVVGIFLLGIVGIVAVVLVTVSGGDEEVAIHDEEPVDDIDRADLAAAAGRAADRIEEGNVPVDNAVYRAWKEMTALFEVTNEETAAPLDFAEAAIDIGFDEPVVLELTELFNEVRYGDKDVALREDRAVELLRDLESQADDTRFDDGSTGGEA